MALPQHQSSLPHRALSTQTSPEAARCDARIRRILVVNSKGGCGKTTLATNIAAYYAAQSCPVALLDHDPQGSSSQWLTLRSENCQNIHGVAAYRRQPLQTRTFAQRLPPDTRRVVLDAPAGVTGPDLVELIREADTVIIPVLPSPLDIHSAAHFIRDLLLVGKVRSRAIRVGVVANRVRRNTKVYRSLQRFVDALEIPFVTHLRDTQNYVHAAGEGMGVHELKKVDNRRDRIHWKQLIDWIEGAERLI